MPFALIRFLVVCALLFAVVWFIALWLSPPTPGAGMATNPARPTPPPGPGWRLQKGALLYALRHAGGAAIIACLVYALGYAWEQDWTKAGVFGGLSTLLAVGASLITHRRPWLRAENETLVWKPIGAQTPVEIPWSDVESITLPWNHGLTGTVKLQRRRGQPRHVTIKASPLGLKAKDLASLLEHTRTTSRPGGPRR